MPALSRAALWGLPLILVLVAASAWWWPSPEPVSAPQALPLPAPAAPATADAGAAPALPAVVASAPVVAALPASGARSAGGVFQSDAAGRLVVDERTRLAVEALVGQNPAEALPALLDAEVQGLPPTAAAAARELALRFDAYEAAQRAAFTPGEAPRVPQEGLAELDTLVALRSSYFGAEAARRMFGADEAVARRLLQLMAEDSSTALSMEQKAQRAQDRYTQEGGLAPPGR